MSELIGQHHHALVLRDTADIEFVGFEELKQSAEKLAANVQHVVVNKENVKESKQLIASINREIKTINDERIKLKKEVLEPYNKIEQQVKEIESIVNEASAVVKGQVKSLDEAERAEKEKKIRALFERRIKHYPFKDLFSFEDFLKPRHLNKSETMTKVEDNLVNWLERIKQDYDVIKKQDNADEILTEYVNTQSLATAINTVQERHEKIQESNESIKNNRSKKEKREQENAVKWINLQVKKSDLKFIEYVLNDNEIEFHKQ